MNKNANNPEDDLRQLLKESSGASTAERSTHVAPPAQASAPADLRSLLREGASTNTSATRQPDRAMDTPPAQSLKGLLHASSGDSNATRTPSAQPGTAKPETSQHLNQALKEVRGQPAHSDPPRKMTVQNSGQAGNLDQALQDNQSSSVQPEVAPKTTTSPWVARAAGAIVFLLVISIAIWWPAQQLEGPPGTLQSLAKAVDNHRHTTGSLPTQLATLEAFPKGAIEWPSKYWGARDAAGRSEIIWIPNGKKHYSIVLRQGAEVWIYRDKEGKSRLASK